ncbi:TonB-dependent SusC/RagA subfamily outer membrane receptor [Dysgonomonas sp. PFB1-18]|uniref:TonB-dependent receptor plug domain-containing protein n=1 Tax=unclassified Dysgonomonas TaxID=2630389 RepID=UPI002474713F|nr:MULTISPECIES: TonB-dependent receptor plug domain-containing protein [unclassified Dysgonomonas]MDH6307193.1 TonB-dependent SusC/RagA subfamily outer membrane receptor [Dysgonomonas sp. PF1-14]MDH6337112.1 TonB-dependent SusC/RagA subfamily outer membrane receptor [Dysgonomonas sp. PF1-16]MDH6381098.1 TonB-dependent SusC/RagA subfamily outer membrane receptor [Dysgonomonas sp. PFB1-18]MDH6396323.1 TonB-dependent SusC/RagA subfamily outer membrane receptor [Dysgonomonas sp. PF1-23]
MKKHIYIIAFILLPVLLISATKYGFVDKLKQSLLVNRITYPDEKTYLQTDKTYYKPSEKIWYKGFLVNGSDNRPSITSDVVYIDLIDPWGKVIQHNEHNTLEGTYSGNFVIAESNPGGLYKIRAYTSWMKNWGEEKYFTKELTVQKVITPRMLLKLDFAKRAYGAGDEVVADLKVTDLSNNKTSGSEVSSTVRIGGIAVQTLTNKTENGEVAIKFNLPKDLNTTDGILQIVVRDKGVEESITRSIPIVLNNIDIQFYPEGGTLVEGVKCKVAFEALNEFGKGADVKGDIVDQSGNKVVSFESFHLGMGAFEFTPEAGKTYYAKVTQPQDCNTQATLPQADKDGYVLKLNSKNEKKISWDIYSPDNTKNVSLVGHTQKEIYYSETLKLKKGWNKVDVNTSEFPIGVAIFTLFDKETEKCERLAFINPDKGLHIEIETNKDTYAPTEEVSLTVKAKDKQGEPVAANIGLAVVDEQLLTMADDKQDNLLSYMLFSSELKGKIEEPYFYFNKEEPKAKEAIDYLMLTHGWRSFVWEEILNPQQKEITHFAEKINTVYGYVLSKDGKPAQTDVYLIETDGRKRIGKIKTTEEGHFVFHDVDYTGNIHVTTRLPNRVVLLNGKPEIAPPPSFSLSPFAANDDQYTAIGEDKVVTKIAESYQDNRVSDIVVPMPEEQYESTGSASQLDEVVVVGYGTQKRANLTGSVSIVRSQELASYSLASQLAGRVPGVMISPADGNPGASSNIRIRGISSQSTQGEPLVIINGIPINDSYSSSLSFINPDDIDNVSVLKNTSSTAIYGSRAANGVILITTKNSQFGQKYIPGKARFAGSTVMKRRFYNATPYNQHTENAGLENSTVYWNGNVRTGNNGEATVSFKNSKQSSTFRITAEGLSVNSGLIGSETKRIVTEKPFSLDAKTPVFAAVNDVINLSVMVRNTTDKPMNSIVSVNLSKGFPGDIQTTLPSQNILIPAKETKNVYFPIRVGHNTGKFNISINATSDMHKDAISREITVRDVNFPYSYSFSGNNTTQTETFTLPDYVSGSLRAEAVAYISVLDELIDGVESIFSVPSGCFEQVSSSTFPNIFALQLLKTTGQTRPEIYKKATEYLKIGYNKLAAYEVKGTGGFEWYGGTPAHEVLSAYGLVEFYEMAKVYDKVDKKKMNRALSFILSRKDGSGGFKQNRGRYGFSGAPRHVNNAYIVYALTETENTSDINKEYQSSLKEALDSKDLYRMALMANTAYNMKDMASYNKLTDYFGNYAQKEDLSKINIESTIVYSHGDAGRRETVAFWLMALLRDGKDMALIEKCVRYINSGRSRGGFGNSQATSICLQALTKYAERIKLNEDNGGEFCVTINNEKLDCKDIKAAVSAGENRLAVYFSDKLKKGRNTIKVEFEQSKNKYPYGVNIYWQSPTPPSSGLCPLKLTTTLGSNTIKVNETVRLSVKLQNTKQEGIPMSIAVIGIPGGMSLQPWQLKELQEKEVFDFYEIINDNLVIYYREFGPSETKIVNLDLKAEIAGQYRGIASSAYQYYMEEFKYWIEGLSVTIE